MMLNPDYSQVILPNSVAPSFFPTACIGYGTNIYYPNSLNTLTIQTLSQTYTASFTTTGTNVSGCALALSSNGSSLFVGNFVTNGFVATGSTGANSQLAYSLIPLTNGIPTTNPPTVTTFGAMIPNQSAAAFFNGNALYQSTGGHDLWYVADYDNSTIWQIDSTTNTATAFAKPTSTQNIAGVASDGTNVYTTAIETATPLLFCSLIKANPNVPNTLTAVSNPPAFIYAADITFVPSPTSMFYIPDAGSGTIYYGTINTLSDPPAWVPSSTTYSLGASTAPYTIGFSNMGGSNTLRFYTMSEPSATDLFKLYLTNGGSAVGGDPHIKPIFGAEYTLPHEPRCYRLFDSGPSDSDEKERIVINCSCWFLDDDIKEGWKRTHDDKLPWWMMSQTYMRYLSIHIGEEQGLTIDLETLESVDESVQFRLPNIIMGPLTDQSKEGLYSVNWRRFETVGGHTIGRKITILGDNIEVELCLALNKDAEDRNNLNFRVKGRKELAEYQGALIRDSPSHEIRDLTSLAHIAVSEPWSSDERAPC